MIKSTSYILKTKVEFRRKKENTLGRFGGGWNWVLGFQLGSKTLIINLLVFSIRFDWSKEVYRQ